ncbi:predicted protein [Naegleria gruberi]|uniref:Predicted protein n=1 Tax=Naegleria gruberi TaxID=5762 RepID=D2V9E7_NAEGR|nr:uncharacterized protein NAEGRDRAFT_65415 [Naegleria gruberi]EFC46448.1 predicted protein [Naegleria gruberi]|eukprot:XP_002679192.1 predicted protein [Naegleria gruberi strain NEG-M]
MLRSTGDRSEVDLDEMLEQDQAKILLFGSGDSGKTTLLKQIHGMTFSKYYNPTRLVGSIVQDILKNVRLVCERCIEGGQISQEEFSQCDYIIQIAKSTNSTSTPKKSTSTTQDSPLPSSPINTPDKRSSYGANASSPVGGGGHGASPGSGAGSPSRMNNLVSKMDDDLPDKILRLLNHSEIFRKTVESCRENERLSDGIEHFLLNSSNLRRVCEFNYVPSIADIVYSRQKTVGLIETSIRYHEVDGFPKKEIHNFNDLEKQFPRTLKLVDTGGQSSERRKYKNVSFSSVRACVFVVNMSGFTKSLYENENVNDLIDSIELFKELFNQPFYENVPILLLFNKMDMFSYQIQKGKDLSSLFPEFDNNATILEEKVDNSLKFLFKKYKDTLNSNPIRVQYMPTALTDLKDAQKVFERVMELSELLTCPERNNEMTSNDKKKCTIM